MFFALNLIMACKKDKNEPASQNPSSTSSSSTSDFLKLGAQTVNLVSSETSWQYDAGDDAYYVATNGAMALATQVSLVDSVGLNASFQYPFSTKAYTLQPTVQVQPSPTYNKATFELAIPTSSQVWVPTGGTITATKNSNGTFTLTFSNVSVIDNTGTHYSTASGRITCQ